MENLKKLSLYKKLGTYVKIIVFIKLRLLFFDFSQKNMNSTFPQL